MLHNALRGSVLEWMQERAVTGGFHDVDITQAVLQRGPRLASLLHGLDEVGHFLPKGVRRLIGNRRALAGNAATLSGAQHAVGDDGTTCPIEIQAIFGAKDGSHSQFGQQAARIVED